MYIVTNIKLSCQSKHICKYTFKGQLKKRPMKVTKINEKVIVNFGEKPEFWCVIHSQNKRNFREIS